MLYNWFSHIDFAYPAAFLLLLLVPLMIWFHIYRSPQQRSSLLISSVKPVLSAISWKNIVRHAAFFFRVMAFICLVVVLARPQVRNDEEMISGEGIDIILCLDVSGSMLAQDFTPNRLEAMKQMAAQFVDKRPTDRIGLVIFAGDSFTSSPITMDRNTLKAQIFAAQTGYLADGTAIGDGLATSVERLKNSDARSKVVVLLTDGDNKGGLIPPLTAKEIAKSLSIKVYTIGMASEGFAPAPTQDESGNVTIAQQKINLDENLLRSIAAETGGLYFRARDNAGLQRIYDEIDKLEKSPIEIFSLKRFNEKYLPFALAAGIFLLLELLLKFTVLRKIP